ncbi:adenylate/guanylate cyclase domain-containing protein [Micromonospora musae]|uniref:Adenylate/guanylate cyclase domain-containing protein n=2 Tax=Micromonospora musae TaxID=1894970 RepID=A0ABX9RIW8_9ACTN|nr:adenylate/guanylate cyclase domain-containing protein [Micromonospora musae]
MHPCAGGYGLPGRHSTEPCFTHTVHFVRTRIHEHRSLPHQVNAINIVNSHRLVMGHHGSADGTADMKADADEAPHAAGTDAARSQVGKTQLLRREDVTMEDFSHYSSLFNQALQDAPHKVVLFVDMVGSTDLKLRSPEVEWLPTMGRFLDLVDEAVRKHGGTVVKYLGDGVLAVFGDEQAANAINAAIMIQESLEADNDGNRLRNCQCRVGLATGKVVEYEGPGGVVDYVGTVVDLAARLSNAASAGAIWADMATTDAANLNKISSRVGRALKRGSREYVSEHEQKVDLKGFAKSIIYKEVIWAQASKGVSNEVTTMMADRAANQRRSDEPAQRTVEGTVTSWMAEPGRGFIRTTDEGDFYVDRRFLGGGGTDLTVGRTVMFIPRPATRADGRPVAGCTVQDGQQVTGQFVTLHDRYGFIRLADSSGNPMNIFVYLGAKATTYEIGQAVTVTLAPGRRGGLQGLVLDVGSGQTSAAA